MMFLRIPQDRKATELKCYSLMTIIASCGAVIIVTTHNVK